MVSVVVCGGGVVGMASALLLARDGHRVTLLEQDEENVPGSAGEAWSSWERKGVPQFRQPHNLFPRFRHVLDADLPDLVGRLEDAGCVWFDFLANLPPSIEERTPRPGDERFRAITGRRPVVESAFAAAVNEEPGLTVRRGVRIDGLLHEPGTDPVRITGVRTADGEELSADLVVDAMGRTSPTVDWLTELGPRSPQLASADSGFVYYTRYFTGPTLPPYFGPATGPIGALSILTFPGDNNTWSVTLTTSSGDAPMKALREEALFTKVVAACPLQAHWLDGEPISGIHAMAGVLDRVRTFVVDGAPVATGVAAVGDAWACTNPSSGRGLSLGLSHAQLLRDLVCRHGDDLTAFACAWHDETERTLAPYVHDQLRLDRLRLAEMNALRAGLPPPPQDRTMARMFTSAMRDGDVFRALLDLLTTLHTREEVLARPGIAQKLEELGADRRPDLPGPSREQLLALLSS